MAEKLLEELQPMLLKLSNDQLVELCVATKAAKQEAISNKSSFRLLNLLNNFFEKGLDDEDGSLLLLGQVKAKCMEFMGSDVVATGSQGGQAQGGIDQEFHEVESERINIQEVSRMQEKRVKLDPVSTDNQAMRRSVSQNVANSNFNLFKRELKIACSISDLGGKDKLSLCGLIRQITAALSKGYSEGEVVEAVIRNLSPGSLLRGYLESIDIGDLSLPKLRLLLRSHYKEKSATELFQELMNLVQSPKEDAQAFLMRALNLRQKVLFVSLESNSKLNANTELVQSVFLQVVESGLRNENIRARLRPVLEKPDASDEDLIHALSVAVTGEEDRQKKLHQANVVRPKMSKVEVLSDQEPPKNKLPLSEDIKQEKGTEALMAAIQSLQKDMTTLKEQVRQTSSYGSQQRQEEVRRTTRDFGCNLCRAKGQGRNCNHCFKCGSTEHRAAGCKETQGKRDNSCSGNWRQPRSGGV